MSLNDIKPTYQKGLAWKWFAVANWSCIQKRSVLKCMQCLKIIYRIWVYVLSLRFICGYHVYYLWNPFPCYPILMVDRKFTVTLLRNKTMGHIRDRRKTNCTTFWLLRKMYFIQSNVFWFMMATLFCSLLKKISINISISC